MTILTLIDIRHGKQTGIMKEIAVVCRKNSYWGGQHIPDSKTKSRTRYDPKLNKEERLVVALKEKGSMTLTQLRLASAYYASASRQEKYNILKKLMMNGKISISKSKNGKSTVTHINWIGHGDG